MRFAATVFVKLLKTRPSLETAAFVIVGWVGVKLTLYTLSHPAIGVVSSHFIHSALWKVIFWTVLLAIAAFGWFYQVHQEKAGRKTRRSKRHAWESRFLKEISFHFHNTYITNKGRYPLISLLLDETL